MNNEKQYPNIPPEAPGEKTSFRDKGSQFDQQREQRSSGSKDDDKDTFKKNSQNQNWDMNQPGEQEEE